MTSWRKKGLSALFWWWKRFAKYCWMGRESWHAIKKLCNIPFLPLKVR